MFFAILGAFYVSCFITKFIVRLDGFDEPEPEETASAAEVTPAPPRGPRGDSYRNAA